MRYGYGSQDAFLYAKLYMMMERVERVVEIMTVLVYDSYMQTHIEGDSSIRTALERGTY